MCKNATTAESCMSAISTAYSSGHLAGTMQVLQEKKQKRELMLTNTKNTLFSYIYSQRR